ncbi:MAG: hypothetical protein ACR2QK_08225 [Acidimicrobiales bacterium]
MAGQRGATGIGVYPGSFNPPTTAHLAIAEAALLAHGLDRIDLTISRSALAKEDVAHPRFEHRIEVLHEAVADVGWLKIEVTELQLLAEIADGYDLLIVGADKWWQIQDPAWYGDDPTARDVALAELPAVAIAPRDGLATPADLTLPVGKELTADISSTRARAGQLDVMVPAARAFAERTGAWVDVARYDRWLTSTGNQN